MLCCQTWFATVELQRIGYILYEEIGWHQTKQLLQQIEQCALQSFRDQWTERLEETSPVLIEELIRALLHLLAVPIEQIVQIRAHMAHLQLDAHVSHIVEGVAALLV